MTSTSPRTPTAAVVLAAGIGSRMQSALPKVMHPIAGRPMLGHVLGALAGEKITPVVVVIGPDMDEVAKAASPHQCVVQKDRLGTGHAVLQAKNALAAFTGDILIVYGDTPFISAETLRKMRVADVSILRNKTLIVLASQRNAGCKWASTQAFLR